MEQILFLFPKTGLCVGFKWRNIYKADVVYASLKVDSLPISDIDNLKIHIQHFVKLKAVKCGPPVWSNVSWGVGGRVRTAMEQWQQQQQY